MSIWGHAQICVIAFLAGSCRQEAVFFWELHQCGCARWTTHTFSMPIGMTARIRSRKLQTTIPGPKTAPFLDHSDGATPSHGGTYGAKSGTISHNGTTELSLTLNVGAAGNISFWRKVSSESGYDFLRFLMNGTELASWSGTQDWTQMSYPVQPGPNTFSLKYTKDGSVIRKLLRMGGRIIFPMAEVPSAAIFNCPKEAILSRKLPLGARECRLVIRNLGTLP